MRRLVLVADRGLVNPDNLETLEAVRLANGAPHEFIIAVPGRRYHEFGELLGPLQRAHCAQATEEVTGEIAWQTRRFIVAHDPAAAALQTARRGEQIAAFIAQGDAPAELGTPYKTLAVTEDFKLPKRVMLAYDGTAVTRKGVDMIASSPLFKDPPIHVLVAGKASADGPKQVAWAKDTLTAAGLEVVADILPGNPEAMIAREAEARGIDMLPMGAYAHSPLRVLIVGSKTTDLLRVATIPTLPPR